MHCRNYAMHNRMQRQAKCGKIMHRIEKSGVNWRTVLSCCVCGYIMLALYSCWELFQRVLERFSIFHGKADGYNHNVYYAQRKWNTKNSQRTTAVHRVCGVSREWQRSSSKRQSERYVGRFVQMYEWKLNSLYMNLCNGNHKSTSLKYEVCHYMVMAENGLLPLKWEIYVEEARMHA